MLEGPYFLIIQRSPKFKMLRNVEKSRQITWHLDIITHQGCIKEGEEGRKSDKGRYKLDLESIQYDCRELIKSKLFSKIAWGFYSLQISPLLYICRI